jgi:hypothetical protein
MKTEIEQIAGAAGVNVLLSSVASTPLLEGARAKGAFIENKSGRGAVLARVLVDATGDGDTAARSGAPYKKGTEEGRMQKPALGYTIAGVDLDRYQEYLQNSEEELIEKLTRARQRGIATPWRLPYWSDLHKGEYNFNTPMLPKDIDGVDASQLSRVKIDARRKIQEVVKFLRESIPGYESIYLSRVAPRIGVRETRHILGEYVLTGRDVLGGRKFPDAIARYACNIDGLTKSDHLPPGTFYEIPYRCLLPRKIDNLLVAGRCFSATHEGAASARMMPCCMQMGQAAGTAAALAARQKISPRRLEARQLQAVLRSQGAMV